MAGRALAARGVQFGFLIQAGFGMQTALRSDSGVLADLKAAQILLNITAQARRELRSRRERPAVTVAAEVNGHGNTCETRQ